VASCHVRWSGRATWATRRVCLLTTSQKPTHSVFRCFSVLTMARLRASAFCTVSSQSILHSRQDASAAARKRGVSVPSLGCGRKNWATFEPAHGWVGLRLWRVVNEPARPEGLTYYFPREKLVDSLVIYKFTRKFNPDRDVHKSCTYTHTHTSTKSCSWAYDRKERSWSRQISFFFDYVKN
jgi:hypothetical protein